MGVEELSQYACSPSTSRLGSGSPPPVPLGGDLIELVAPFKYGTTAGRLLEKRGDGGYMIIMQTEDAKKRRDYLEKQGLAKVIFTHDHDDVVCTQYHPKGIKGMSLRR